MSNRLFQTIIHQFKDVVGDRTIGVLDDNDVIIACSELGRIGETRVGIRETAGVENGPFSSGGFTYRYIEGGINPEYIPFIEGEDRGPTGFLRYCPYHLHTSSICMMKSMTNVHLSRMLFSII